MNPPDGSSNVISEEKPCVIKLCSSHMTHVTSVSRGLFCHERLWSLKDDWHSAIPQASPGAHFVFAWHALSDLFLLSSKTEVWVSWHSWKRLGALSQTWPVVIGGGGLWLASKLGGCFLGSLLIRETEVPSETKAVNIVPKGFGLFRASLSHVVHCL